MRALMVLFALLLVSPAAAQQKVIKDATESNAYTTALNTKDGAERAAAMEAFAARYPKSIKHLEALERAMVDWQSVHNTDKVGATAAQIVKLAPNHVQALSIEAYLLRLRATKGDQAAFAAMRADAERGLAGLPKWRHPDWFSEADDASARREMTSVLNGALGFAALQEKDYAKARPYLLAAVAAKPKDLQNVYQLSIACLQSTPVDADGFWYGARALALAASNPASRDPISKYVVAKYRHYHGSEDGWSEIVGKAEKSSAAPPAGFAQSIKPAPGPEQLAVRAVAENDPKDLSFSDREFILSFRDASPENKAAADKVWQQILALQKDGAAKLKLPVKVIAASATSLDGAITDDNQSANTVDLRVTLAKPAGKPPTPGTMVSVIGRIKDYQPKPFLFLMVDGEVGSP